MRFRKEGSPIVRQSDYNPGKQAFVDQEPVASESISVGHSPAKLMPRLTTKNTDDMGWGRTPGCTSVKQYVGERSRDVPVEKVPDGLAGKMVEQCTSDYMESDEKMGGTTCINEQDLVGDLEGKNTADSRKGDENQREKLLTRNDTEVNVQNSVEDRGVLKEPFCIEQSVEDTILNEGASLVNGKMTKDEYVAGKKLCNNNVAVESYGSQQEVSPF